VSSHLPALQVIVPLIAAPACVLFARARLAWWVALGASLASFAIALALLRSVLDGGEITYAMGGWAAPFGIEYRIDAVNAFVLFIVSGASAVLLPYARASIEHEVAADRVYLLYSAWLLSLAGLLGIAITGDLFNLFVFLEVASLSSYTLVSLGRDRRALLAAFRYLVIGTIGATFILIGIGLLYAMTGTLNMADLAARLPAVAQTRTVRAAVAFFAVGIAIKMALFPMHFWLPAAYCHAPSAVSAFLASTGTKVAVYVLLRVFFTVFGTGLSFDVLGLDRVLMPLALLGVVVGSGGAIYQADIKRMLAWSSIAQIGYMVLGISLQSVNGLTGGIVHLFNHAAMKAALFMAIGCVAYRTGATSLTAVRGMGRRMPYTLAAFVAAGLSLIGVPLTGGFVSKWYLVAAALDDGAWAVAGIIVLTSLLAVIYIWRVVEAAYFLPPPTDEPAVSEAPLSMLAPLWFLVAVNVYAGVQTDMTAAIARYAARGLLGLAP